MIYIYMLDPGHREDTPGKEGNGLREYEFNEDVARRLEKRLQPHGEVSFTIDTPLHPYSEMTASGRSSNLNARTSRANQIYYEAVKKYGNNGFKMIYVSIHANAFENPSVSGYEIFVYQFGGEGHGLAKAVHKQAQIVLGVGTAINDRKIKEGNFAVLRNTKMPAILVEHEFFTNPAAAQKLKDTHFRDKCAEHLYEGILDYMDIKEGIKVIYRVRKEWGDPKSQLNAYSSLEYAINEVDNNPGYKVYDNTGNQVYPKVVDERDILTRLNDLENRVDKLEGKQAIPPTEIKGDDIILSYDRVLKQGMKGEDVRKLQSKLAELGYYISNIDGSFGPATDKAVRAFQSANSLVVDGTVGYVTIQALNSKKKDRKSKGYMRGNAKIIETTPDNLTPILATEVEDGAWYGTNLQFFNRNDPTNPDSCWGIATADGKPIGGNSMLVDYKGSRHGTFVYYEDGTMDVVIVNNINEFEKPHIWAASGYYVYPIMEPMPSTIDYTTSHTYIAFKGDKIFQIVKPYHRVSEILDLVRSEGYEKIIKVDGGGSAELHYLGMDHNTTRVQNNLLVLKEL